MGTSWEKPSRTEGFSAYTARSLLISEIGDDVDLPALPGEFSAEEQEWVMRRLRGLRSAHNAVLDGRMFWLGDILADLSNESIQRGGKLWGEGDIDHPFGTMPYVCCFRMRGTDENIYGVTLKVCPLDPMPINEGGSMGQAALLIYSQYGETDGRWEVVDYEMMKVVCNGSQFSEVNIGNLSMANSDLLPPRSGERSELAMMFFFYILQLLNTDGIERTVMSTDPKLARSRARSGKKALPDYIKLSTEAYVTALITGRDFETDEQVIVASGDGREMPAHRRRGHRRYLNPERTRWVWVRDCIVRADKVSPDNPNFQRLYYDVKQPRSQMETAP